MQCWPSTTGTIASPTGSRLSETDVRQARLESGGLSDHERPDRVPRHRDAAGSECDPTPRQNRRHADARHQRQAQRGNAIHCWDGTEGDTGSQVGCIQELGCAFCQNSAGFRRNLAKRHRQEWNVKVQSTGMHYNTNFVILVHSGWYLSTRFLQVENARTYSK